MTHEKQCPDSFRPIPFGLLCQYCEAIRAAVGEKQEQCAKIIDPPPVTGRLRGMRAVQHHLRVRLAAALRKMP